MPVFNSARTVGAALKSILVQSYADFEFLIIDDGSTDGSQSTIRSYADSRIRFVQNEKNLGVAESLNRGLEMAHGEYIARMDSDDISVRCRLEHQVRFMDARPDVGISGSWVRLFGDQPRITLRSPVGPFVIKAFMLFDNPLFHPSVIMRRQSLEKHKLRYDPGFSRTEDYDLWVRGSQYFLLDNLPEVLVLMRIHRENITSTTQNVMMPQTEKILSIELQNLDVNPTNEELAFHHIVGRGRRLKTRLDIERAETWLLALQDRNREVGVYEPDAFAKAAGMVWFRLCRNSAPLGRWVWRRYRASPLVKKFQPPLSEVVRFWASIIWHNAYCR